MDWLSDPQAWIGLLTLTVLEIVLGIDNVIFISILSGKLPPAQRGVARRLGLGLAMGVRILLLLSISWVVRLTDPMFTLVGREIRAATSSCWSAGCSCWPRRRTRSTASSKERLTTAPSRRRPPSPA